MAVPTHIADPKSGYTARVSEFGQLITAPIAYSLASNATLDVVDTAFNFIEPSSGHKIVITDIILTADKNVGASGASVQVYGASSIDSTTIGLDAGVLDIEMLKNTSRDLIGLNILSREGIWINAKTDDANIRVTIGYYRVPID